MRNKTVESVLFILLCCCGANSAWATDVTLRLVDQSGQLIPGSQFSVLTAGSATVLQGGVISLPVGSHTVRLFSGVNGVAAFALFRDESITVGASMQAMAS